VDPVTQTLLGAVTAGAFMGRRLGHRALLLGAVAGELPDADVFLGPLADPALPFELHRHFTHSLLFIPVGGLIATAPFLLLRGFRTRAWAAWGAATIGCATHGLLDNCTSYGTHLLWPFMSGRTAWDCMSIIDPIFSSILFAGLVGAMLLRREWRRGAAGLALVLALLYIGLGFAQHARAERAAARLAAERGHEPVRARVMPTLGNLVLWRSVYEYEGQLQADALRLLPWGEVQVRQGRAVPRITADDLPAMGAGRARAEDVLSRFSAFATGFVAAVPAGGGGLTVGDVRYSLDTAGFEPLWGLRIDPRAADDPVRAVGFRAARGASWLRDFWRELTRPGPEYRSLDQPAGRPAAAGRASAATRPAPPPPDPQGRGRLAGAPPPRRAMSMAISKACS
jgi:inner membrane protein